MKLSTEKIKEFILKTYPEVSKKSLKRVNKFQNENKEIVRVFSSGTGQITVVSDKSDLTITGHSKTAEITSSKADLPLSNYIFAIDETFRFDNFIFKRDIIDFEVCSKTQLRVHKDITDVPVMKVQNILRKYQMENQNETGTYTYWGGSMTRDQIIEFLESFGMSYSNELAELLINKYEAKVLIKP